MNEDPDKYCMTDKGPMLWKDIAQRYADDLEWHRSSLNPKWDGVRLSERERCAKIAEEAGRHAMNNFVLCGPSHIVRQIVKAIRG